MAGEWLEPYIMPLCALMAFTGLVLVYLDLVRPGAGNTPLGIIFIAIGLFGEYRELANRRLKRLGKYDYSKIRANQKWF